MATDIPRTAIEDATRWSLLTLLTVDAVTGSDVITGGSLAGPEPLWTCRTSGPQVLTMIRKALLPGWYALHPMGS